jgi:hypothetical protein
MLAAMAAQVEPFLLPVDANWQPGDPVHVPESSAVQLAPGLGSTAVIARVLDDGAVIAFATASISTIAKTADDAGATLSLVALRFARDPRRIRANEASDILDDLQAEEPIPSGFEELAQADFAGIDEELSLQALNANEWRCQLTGQRISMGASIEDHVTLIVPLAFDGAVRPDNLLTLSDEASRAWRGATVSVNPDLSIVANLGGMGGNLKANLATHLSVPSERFRPSPVYLRFHRYRIFDRVPALR